jgi:hypothetical protein
VSVVQKQSDIPDILNKQMPKELAQQNEEYDRKISREQKRIEHLEQRK